MGNDELMTASPFQFCCSKHCFTFHFSIIDTTLTFHVIIIVITFLAVTPRVLVLFVSVVPAERVALVWGMHGCIAQQTGSLLAVQGTRDIHWWWEVKGSIEACNAFRIIQPC